MTRGDLRRLRELQAQDVTAVPAPEFRIMLLNLSADLIACAEACAGKRSSWVGSTEGIACEDGVHFEMVESGWQPIGPCDCSQDELDRREIVP